jgi:hypothetical protein
MIVQSCKYSAYGMRIGSKVANMNLWTKEKQNVKRKGSKATEKSWSSGWREFFAKTDHWMYCPSFASVVHPDRKKVWSDCPSGVCPLAYISCQPLRDSTKIAMLVRRHPTQDMFARLPGARPCEAAPSAPYVCACVSWDISGRISPRRRLASRPWTSVIDSASRRWFGMRWGGRYGKRFSFIYAESGAAPRSS